VTGAACPTLGIGVLSWHGYDSLAASLASHRAGKLFDHADEALVFLPEISDRGRDIARRFDLPFAGSAQNLGILGGFKALAESFSTDLLILIENDYQLVEPAPTVSAQLTTARADIAAGAVAFVMLRHRLKPGEPWSIDKVRRLHPPVEAPPFARLTAAIGRALRPDKASRLLGRAAYLWERPEKVRPDVFSRSQSGTIIVSSRHLPWSNCPTLVPRRFYLEQVIAEAEARTAGRLINGFPSIETELNTRWWRERNIPIGIAVEGLFSQIRQEYRGY